MKTSLTARNLELSDRLRSQIEHKLRRLDRITHEMAEAEVELIANASHATDSAQVAEVTLRNNGDVLRSSASGATPIAALDIVVDKLERQLVRTKETAGQHPQTPRGRGRIGPRREGQGTIEPDSAARAEGGGPSVVKIKRFDMQPMFEEDAIAQMEDLGHAFFVYLDAETEDVAVLYRRGDGSYGVIQPVIGSSNGRAR